MAAIRLAAALTVQSETLQAGLAVAAPELPGVWQQRAADRAIRSRGDQLTSHCSDPKYVAKNGDNGPGAHGKPWPH